MNEKLPRPRQPSLGGRAGASSAVRFRAAVAAAVAVAVAVALCGKDARTRRQSQGRAAASLRAERKGRESRP
jgi:hypothetical protein